MVVYKITNTTNGKTYIGITKELKRRVRKHRRADTDLGHDIRNIGFEKFTVEILCETEDVQLAKKLERFYIHELNTKSPNGYNRSDGGEWSEISEETREHIRQTLLGFGWKGETHPVYGHKHTDEFKDARRNAWVGENNPNYGKFGAAHPCSGPMSEEQKEKISKANRKPRPSAAGGNNPSARKVRNIETGEVFTTMKEAAEKYGTSKSKICVVCKGQRKTAGGYHWEYAD